MTLTTLFMLSLLNRVENPSLKRRHTLITVLNISAVESRFYLYPFTCLAKNSYGRSAAYVQLRQPGKQQNYLFEMQFCLTVVRCHGVEVCEALSSARSSLGFLLTWVTSIPLSLLTSSISSSRKLFCPAVCPQPSSLPKQMRLGLC